MSINKDSTADEICSFLKQKGFIKNENIIANFKKENIKGNEILFLQGDDFINLGFKLFKKIIKNLEAIKTSQKEILEFNENIDENSTEKDVYNFLKNEIKLDEKTLENFRNINGQKLKELKNENLINLGLKLGERRKLIKYFQSQSKNLIELTINSTIEEVCEFLKVRFNIDEETLNALKESEIDGKTFFNLSEEDFEELNINDADIKKDILYYIFKNKPQTVNKDIKETKIIEENKIVILGESEDEIDNEEIFKHYLLIDILEYITSEEDLNKCPSNNLENFIQLCEDMNINNENNCEKINFDQADKIQLKSATLWGTKEGLYEFFEKRKMKKTINYFKEENKEGSGIILAIKEDKSLAYIIIWPGKMSYIYKQYDEPQKSLLLSLVRIGFSLSDNCIFCLSEEQRKEFDFQAINELYNVNAFKITVGEVKFNDNIDDYFKLENKIKIDFEAKEIEGNISNIKLNRNSIFLYMQTEEKTSNEVFNKIPLNNFNFNIENALFKESFELDGSQLYKFLKRFQCFSKLLQDKNYLNFKTYEEKRINDIKKSYCDLLSKILKINFNNIKCEICHKIKNLEDNEFSLVPSDINDLEPLHLNICENHNYHILHSSCLISNTNNKIVKCLNNNRFIFMKMKLNLTI